MADKPSTLKLKVNLDCKGCNKKIQEFLLKIQVEEGITTILYDVKNNTVTISGPFDPYKLKQKLLCKAGKLIQEITIVPQKVPSIRKVQPSSSSSAGNAIVPSIRKGQPPSSSSAGNAIVPQKVPSIRKVQPPSSSNAGNAIVPRNAIRDLFIVPIPAIRNVRPQPPVEVNINVKFGGGCSSCGGSSR